jgi:hypothetical protein
MPTERVLQQSSTKPRYEGSNRYGALDFNEQDQVPEMEQMDPEAVLAELRQQYDPKKPQNSEPLRIKLRDLCKGRSIPAETRVELLKLGFGKEILQVPASN